MSASCRPATRRLARLASLTHSLSTRSHPLALTRWLSRRARPACSYSSIPQKNKSSQLAAIDSIAGYAALCKYFIAVAPATIHANTGLQCDAQTYLGRGW